MLALWMCLSWFFTTFSEEYATAAMLGMAMTGALLFISDPSMRALILYIVAALVGAMGAILLVQYGYLSFTTTGLYGIPNWLAFACGNASLVLLQLKHYIVTEAQS